MKSDPQNGGLTASEAAELLADKRAWENASILSKEEQENE